VAANQIVVVGMRHNPFPKMLASARDDPVARYNSLEYGIYPRRVSPGAQR